MSKRPLDQPPDGPLRPVRQLGGRARLESLSRHDVEDDPDHGTLLYKAVVDQDTTELTGDGWLDRLEAIIRLKARLAALEAEAVAGFDDSLHGVSADLGHRHPEPGDRAATAGERRWIAGDLRSVSDEIALILELRRGHATRRIHTSCELVHNFPATLHALTEGWLTERAAFTIVTELSILDDLGTIRAAEAAILDWAGTHPLADIKDACRREVARRSPAALDKAHQRAHDERSVRMYTDDNGRADIVHNQSALDGAAVMTSLSRAATYRRRQGDSRSMDQLRADIALARLLPRTKHTDTISADTTVTDTGMARADTDVTADTGSDVASDTNPYANDAPPATEPPTDPAYEPSEDATADVDAPHVDLGHESPADGEATNPPYADSARPAHRGADHPAMGESTEAGLEATVVIHATGAELRALITGEEGTGGEADQHGPLPQSTLRKYLLQALAQGLLPNLPTTPNSPRPGAATFRARTTADRSTPTRSSSPSCCAARTASCDGTAANRDGSAASCGGCAASCGGSRIEVRVVDEPPPSDPDRYTPSAALERYVRWRDRTCQFPGCNRPAEFTDVDHRVAFAAGGRTTAANLWCLCRHHHRLKHEGGWQIQKNPDNSYTWISPTGRRYRTDTTDPPDAAGP